MGNLNITERRNDSVLILDLDGKIKLGDGCSELHDALRLLIEKGEKKVLLNMAGASYIDSSGLGELVGGYAAFQRGEAELKLLNLSPNVHQLMTLTKLLTVFDVFESESHAVDNFDRPTPKAVYVSRLE